MNKAPQPPLLKGGEIDFEAWKNRLLTKGIRGDIDSVMNRAKGTGADALAAQGELRNLERYADDGYDVFVLTPPGGIGATQGIRTAEAVIAKSGIERKLEVKTATEPPAESTWNKRIGKANKQIKQGGMRGIITLDFSKITLRRGKRYLSNQTDVETFLVSRMRGDLKTGRFRSVDELEVIYFDPEDGNVLKRTYITRDSEGVVLPPKTERIDE